MATRCAIQSCIKDLWAERTCFGNRRTQPGKTQCRSIVLDCCWIISGCVLALTKDSVFSTVCQHHPTQARSNHFYYRLHYSLLHHVLFWKIRRVRLFIYWHWFLFWEAKQLTFAMSVEIALARESISRELGGLYFKDAAVGMHALGHSSSGQAQQPRPARSKRGRGGVRNGDSRWGQQQSLQVLSLRPEPSRVDMQVQAVWMSRMPQKGSSQVNVPQRQSRVPRRANVRGRGRRGRDS